MSPLLDEFIDRGVVRIPAAFTADEAKAIASTVWGSLERRTQIRRDDASTWPSGHAPGVSFKSLKGRRVFEPVVRSERVQRALDEILGPAAWQPPKVGAQVLLTFPSPGPWVMPNAWHIDGSFDQPVWPPPAIRMFSFFDGVEAEGGGTLLLAGSHHLVERYMAEWPTPIPGNSVTWGRFMKHHPKLVDLHRAHTSDAPLRELVGSGFDVDGTLVEPIELTGEPGDLYLAHFYVLHSGSPNVSNRPRQMLSTTASLAPRGTAPPPEVVVSRSPT